MHGGEQKCENSAIWTEDSGTQKFVSACMNSETKRFKMRKEY